MKENKRNFFNHFLKRSPKMIDVSIVSVIEYTPEKTQMMKDFSQMTEQDLEDTGELEYDDGLFQQLEVINQPLIMLWMLSKTMNVQQIQKKKKIKKKIPLQVSFQPNNQHHSMLWKKKYWHIMMNWGS